MIQVKNWILGGLLAVVLAGGALAGDFQKGLDAYNAGAYATALAEWTHLAELGDADAQFALGVLYYQGKGVVFPNYQIAYMWFALAAAQGHRDALTGRADAVNRMTPREYIIAQLMAEQCLAQFYRGC